MESSQTYSPPPHLVPNKEWKWDSENKTNDHFACSPGRYTSETTEL